MFTRKQKIFQNKKLEDKRRRLLENSVQTSPDDKSEILKSENVVITKIAQDPKNKKEVPIEVLLDNSTYKEVQEIRMSEEVYSKLIKENKNVFYYCDICTKFFVSEKLQTHHYTIMHRPLTISIKKGAYCDNCHRILDEKFYDNHYPCFSNSINFKFNRYKKTNYYVGRIGLVFNTIKCRICKLQLKSKILLFEHLKTTHRPLTTKCDYIKTTFCDCVLDSATCNNNYSTITKTSKKSKSHSSINEAAILSDTSDNEIQINLEEDKVEDSENQQKAEVVKTPKEQNRIYKCTVCGLTARFRGFIFDHTVLHHRPWSVEIKPGIYCPRCNEWFISEENYTGHHPCYRVSVAARCQICYMSLPLREHFLLHKVKFINGHRLCCNICENNSTVYNLGTLNKHRKEDHNKIGVFECLKCEVNFKNLLTLKRHLVKCDNNDDVNLAKIYHLQKNLNAPLEYFTCNYCDKIYFSQYFLDLHVNTSHLLKKKDLCFMCGQAFKNVSMLKVHLNSAHFKKVTYDCTKCTKKFLVKKNLIQHNKIHENKKQFKCSLCPKVFVQQTSLIYHMAHHTGENVFKCSICALPFDKQKKLSSHMEKHNADGTNPHKCEICDKFFTHKCNLLVHMRIHTVQSKE